MKQRQNKNRNEGGERQNKGSACIGPRYTDKDLEEFAHIIRFRLEEAESDYRLLSAALSRHKKTHDENSPTFKLTDDSNTVLTKKEIVMLALKKKKQIEQLENALRRVDNKTYGICAVTGKLIAKERLTMKPQTIIGSDIERNIIYLN